MIFGNFVIFEIKFKVFMSKISIKLNVKLFFVFVLFGQLLAAQEVTVMSYNIRYGTANDGENSWDIRKSKVANLINYYEADFIGMQEVQSFQRDFLLTQMPQYNAFGKPRSEDKNAEYSPIFYNKNNQKR